jgi:hypothetical protein
MFDVQQIEVELDVLGLHVRMHGVIAAHDFDEVEVELCRLDASGAGVSEGIDSVLFHDLHKTSVELKGVGAFDWLVVKGSAPLEKGSDVDGKRGLTRGYRGSVLIWETVTTGLHPQGQRNGVIVSDRSQEVEVGQSGIIISMRRSVQTITPRKRQVSREGRGRVRFSHGTAPRSCSRLQGVEQGLARLYRPLLVSALQATYSGAVAAVDGWGGPCGAAQGPGTTVAEERVWVLEKRSSQFLNRVLGPGCEVGLLGSTTESLSWDIDRRGHGCGCTMVQPRR